MASIRRSDNTGGEFAPQLNTRVGNFENKMQEVFGIKVQVTGSDDSYFSDNNHTLLQAREYDASLMEKRSRRQERAEQSVEQVVDANEDVVLAEEAPETEVLKEPVQDADQQEPTNSIDKPSNDDGFFKRLLIALTSLFKGSK